MCIACLEYLKGNLRLKEYKSALRETVRDGSDPHVEELQTLIYDHEGDEDSLRNKIKSLQPSDSSSS